MCVNECPYISSPPTPEATPTYTPGVAMGVVLGITVTCVAVTHIEGAMLVSDSVHTHRISSAGGPAHPDAH